MDLASQTVLVTGAGGFIGSHLTERLVSLGAKTRAMVRYTSTGTWGWLDDSPAKGDIEVVQGDVRDRDSVGRAVRGVDVVFHLAALVAIPYSYQAPLSYVRTNVEGTLNVLQESLDNNVKAVVHTSTSEVYGTAQYVPMDEEHPLQGQSPYSATKIGADKLCEAFHRSFGLPVTVLRPFNTFGPRQSARAVIPTIITQALTQQTVKLGNPAPTRDFSYVGDTVDGFIDAAASPGAIGQVVNLGTGREMSIGDLAGTVLKMLSQDKPVVTDPQRLRPENSEVDRLCADNTKARELLDWSPQHTLEDALLETANWVQSHIEEYRLGVYAV